ncbi:MAG: hypothetical protein ABH834_08085 [Candidatus Altiarchaeota archaeon]
MKIIPVITALMILSLSVQAWGPATHRHICDEAVKEAFGLGVASKCLPRKSSAFMDEFCAQAYKMTDAETYRECRDSYKRREFIHPANMPDELFNDTENFHDYSKCPIRPGPAKQLLCGSKDDAPAPREANRWFDEAKRASETCMKVYMFCIGSAYYAESENPVNQVMNEEEDCYNAIVNGIEEGIAAGKDTYRARTRCEFKDSSYEHDMLVTEKRINGIIEDLVEIGKNISSSEVEAAGNVVFLANTADFDANHEFYVQLQSKGLSVSHANAENFNTLKYAQYVIILGGHRSGEGVGEITDTVLMTEEKNNLLASQDAYLQALSQDVWKLDQKVWVLAGYEKEQTRKAVEEYGSQIITAILSGE